MQIGDIVTLSVATPITRVIFDYNRNCTCVRVRTKYNSFTDEKVMPLKKGCTVWICSKNKKSGGFSFMSFKMRVEDAQLEKQLVFNSIKDIDNLEDIDAEMHEFLMYAFEKLA